MEGGGGLHSPQAALPSANGKSAASKCCCGFAFATGGFAFGKWQIGFGECPWTAVRLSGPFTACGEWGRRAGGTIELAAPQRPLTLPRARAPLSRGVGGGHDPSLIPSHIDGGDVYNPSYIEGGV